MKSVAEILSPGHLHVAPARGRGLKFIGLYLCLFLLSSPPQGGVD